jgi:DNA ligase D-like protein (predicted 3'-phosphoesterase)
MPTKDPLKNYRAKRDFKKTGEPAGAKTQTKAKTKIKTKAAPKTTRARKPKAPKLQNPMFVIQKHAARRLHYDFRLEVNGVLKSWAVPKGPSTDPADKRLAVHVEDHPMEYAAFEGIIPQGEYGGGTVMVWDAGTYTNLRVKEGKEVPLEKCIEQGTVEIRLQGNKLQGGWALIRTRSGDDDRNWLLVKMRDEAADPGKQPVEKQKKSVLTDRTIEQIAAAGDESVWTSNRPKSGKAA